MSYLTEVRLYNILIKKLDHIDTLKIKEAIEIFLVFMRCTDILASNICIWKILDQRFIELSRKSLAIAKLKPRWKKLRKNILKSPYYRHISILDEPILQIFLNKYDKYKSNYYE